MRANYLPGVFIGIVLIYLSIFGLSGFSLPFALAPEFSDNFDDNSLSTNLWQPYAQAGATVKEQNRRLEFTQQDSSQGWYAYVKTVNQFDLSTSDITIDSGITTGRSVVVLHVSPDLSYITAVSSAYRIQWEQLWLDQIRVVRWIGGVAQTLATASGSADGLRIQGSGGSISFSYKKSGQWVEVYTETYLLPTTNCHVYLAGHAYSGEPVGTQWVDNFNLETSGQPPPPPPDTGSIRLYAWDGLTHVSASLSITFPDGTTKTATTPYENSAAPVGMYSVTCTYSGSTQSHSFSLSQGGTETKTFSFGDDTPPPPPTPFDFLEWLNQFLANATVRSLMLIGGITLVGLCGIMAFTPEKKRYAPRPPLPSYY